MGLLAELVDLCCLLELEVVVSYGLYLVFVLFVCEVVYGFVVFLLACLR